MLGPLIIQISVIMAAIYTQKKNKLLVFYPYVTYGLFRKKRQLLSCAVKNSYENETLHQCEIINLKYIQKLFSATRLEV